MNGIGVNSYLESHSEHNEDRNRYYKTWFYYKRKNYDLLQEGMKTLQVSDIIFSRDYMLY